MTRRITLALALAIFVVPVLALTLGGALENLERDIDSRLDAIGADPDTGALKREAKKLQKALDLLDTYVGTNDIPDLKILGKAGIQILRSKTTDEAIWDDVRDVVQALIDMAKQKRGLGQDVLDRLYDERYQKQVQKLLDKGDKHLDKAIELLEELPVKSHKSVIKAWKQYLKSVLKGEKLEDRAEEALPDHLIISQNMFDLVLSNTANKDHFIRDVLLTGEWRDEQGAVVATVDKASVAAVWPAGFKITVFGSGSTVGWDCPCMISRTSPGDPAQYESLWNYFYQYKELALPGSGRCAFFGSIVVVVTDRYQNGKTYQLPFTPTARYFD